MTALIWLALTTAAAFLGAELIAWSSPLQRALVRRAAEVLPSEYRDRYLEEWYAELEEQPNGPITRLIFAVSLFAQRGELARELGVNSALRGVSATTKHLLDRTAAAVLIIVLSPTLLIIATAVRLTSPGPAVYRQVRVGRDGLMFTMLKFRTMFVDADVRRAELLGESAANGGGPMFWIRSDPRVTRLGRFLRRYSLDELPQLFNILRGEMSLVGPRPALPEEVAAYSGKELRRMRVPPGLTGLWQTSGRGDLSWSEAIRLDLEYVDKWSLRLDLKLLLKTILAVLRGRGAV